MRREGRQHGMVRTCPALSALYTPRPKSGIPSGPPTAGLFTKVPSKPTNHSKFTGKCGRPQCRGCHVGPACKSRGKAKGAHKARSAAADYSEDEDYYDDGDDYDRDLIESDRRSWCARSRSPPPVRSPSRGKLEIVDELSSRDQLEIDVELSSREQLEIDGGSSVESVDDDKMSYCEVGILCGSEDGDESWCLVDEKNVTCS